MKRISLASLLVVVSLSAVARAETTPASQDLPSSQETRPRTASPAPAPQPSESEQRPVATPENVAPSSEPEGAIVGTKPEARPQVAGPAATERRVEPPTSASLLLSPPQIQTRIAEAERLLKSRPLQTAMSSPSIELVTLAALDRATSRIHLVTLYKDVFLTKGSELTVTSSLATPLSIRILRANGVNTAVAVFDGQGNSLVPL